MRDHELLLPFMQGCWCAADILNADSDASFPLGLIMSWGFPGISKNIIYFQGGFENISSICSLQLIISCCNGTQKNGVDGTSEHQNSESGVGHINDTAVHLGWV